jgi:hypothetical protein
MLLEAYSKKSQKDIQGLREDVYNKNKKKLKERLTKIFANIACDCI